MHSPSERAHADSSSTVTWPELMAATSLAADRAMGLVLETGLATCLVAVQLGRAAGLDDGELRRAYHLALLQHVGCTAASSEVADVTGDELLMREHSSTLDFSDQWQTLLFMLGHVRRANPWLARPMALVRALAGAPRILATAVDVCEAAQLLGTRCGYDPHWREDLATVYEHWDGSGFPGRASGEAIPRPTLVVQVASLAVNAERLVGPEAAITLVAIRRGHMLSPAVTNVFLASAEEILSPLESSESLWDMVMAANPAPTVSPQPGEMDAALAALGDFADLKSPYLLGHSRAVAERAARAARCYGLGSDDVGLVRRAGYVHDIGRVAVASSTWNATRPLRPHETEQVRLHPYYTDQVLSRTLFLRSLSDVASFHHERLDGTGYFRGVHGTSLGVGARILGAADAYQTKTEERPHRPAFSADEAAAHLQAEAEAGRLDRLAVDAVLAAGGPGPPPGTPRLTSRELEILVEASRGSSMRQIARALSISPKTVDGHLQRIYPKIGVSSRGGATLYALEHGLLPAQRPPVQPA